MAKNLRELDMSDYPSGDIIANNGRHHCDNNHDINATSLRTPATSLQNTQVQKVSSQVTRATSLHLAEASSGNAGDNNPGGVISPRACLRAREAIQAGKIIRILYRALELGTDVGELPKLVELAQTENHNADQIFGELLLVFSKLPADERGPAMRLAKEVFG